MVSLPMAYSMALPGDSSKPQATYTDRLFANCHESRSLAAQRDALLPRLVSGEFGV